MICPLIYFRKVNESSLFSISDEGVDEEITWAAVLVCRSAMVKSPAASRSAFAAHGESIDPTLAHSLEVVGSYSNEHGCTSLHKAVINGDALTVQSLIQAGATLDAEDINGATPLELVTDSTCRDLLKHHAEVLTAVAVNPIILVSAVLAHCATLSGFEEYAPTTVLSLREYHFDPFFLWAPLDARAAVFAWARNAFIAQLAAATLPFVALPDDCAGDVLEFLELTNARAEALHITGQCSSSEAHAWVRSVVLSATTLALAAKASATLVPAADEDDLMAVVDCLTRGANVDVRSTFDDTALMKASYNGYTVMVKLLLSAGANVDAKDEIGNTALIKALTNKHTAIVELLVSAGADTEAKGIEGWTALIWASFNGCGEVVKLLLKAKADKDARDKNGDTPLMSASRSGGTAIVEILLSAGAEKDAKNIFGDTALTRASFKGYTTIVELLLSAGADKDAKDNNGNTALLKASYVGHTAAVELLLEAGANKDAADMDGTTALMKASRIGDAAAVRFLLSAGADKDAHTIEGSTALMMASRNGHNAVVVLLLSARADAETEDNDGNTALGEACGNGNHSIVVLLARAISKKMAKMENGLGDCSNERSNI